MTRYLQSKPGSIEEVAAKMSKYAAESEYQQMFKKELEKAGKGIGSMTPAEKKAFFNKIDSKYTAKNEAVDNPYAVGMAVAKKMKNDEPPLKKSTITKAHDIAKSIAKDDKKEEVEESAASDKAKAMGLTYLHFGRYGKDGKVTHKNIGGNLTRVGKDEKPIKSSDKASKDQPNKSSKVTSDVVDIEPRELKKQAKKYGLTVKIGSGDPDEGYEVEFKGPKKNILKYYKKYMGYDGDDFEGLASFGEIGENKLIVNGENLEEVKQKEIDKFHTDLDSLVHKTFGHSSKETEKMDEKVASSIIKDLQKAYAPMKGKRISPEMANKISKHLDQPSYDLNVLRQLKKADIPFISTIARNKIYKKTGKFEDRRLYVEAVAGLQKKANKSGMPYSILKQVYDRGMAAWKSGHRPGASQQQWAFARVNSFITKSSGTWGGADKDLAAKVKGSK